VTADDDRKRRLEKTVTDIQNRFGLRIISRSAEAVAPSVIPTGFPALDAALGIGGLPRGRVAEIVGVPTSGAATLALKAVAQAQERDGTAVYIDIAQTFDPDYAHRCGLDLHRLMLIHPYNIQQAIAMLPDFMADGTVDLLVFDMPLHPPPEPERQQQLSSALGRLLAPLSRSGSILLFVTSLRPDSDPPHGSSPLPNAYPRHLALPHYASLRLLVRRARWLHRREDVRGYEADILVLKNKLGPAGREVRVAITFNGTVRGDSV
jgi:recombination protein RecA